VTLVACGAVVLLIHEHDVEPTRFERFRSILAAPWHVVRREKHVRRFLIANTAWEATFAGIRTFVVLYIIDGLGQPLYVSSTVLGVVAAGYVVAAIAAGKFGDEFGVGNVILGASVVYGFGLLVAGFAQTWHWWYYALIAPVAVAGGVVMTLAWALLFKVMPTTDRGTITGLATTTKGIGLIIGPLAAGAAIDIFHGYFRSTDGYAVIWPVVAVPVLAVIPLVALLAEAEGNLKGTARYRAS
jgi:MFS family permease